MEKKKRGKKNLVVGINLFYKENKTVYMKKTCFHITNFVGLKYTFLFCVKIFQTMKKYFVGRYFGSMKRIRFPRRSLFLWITPE
jgi:hypothetical protein